MNALELALEKQRLLLESALQREALERHGNGLLPLFEAADRVQQGARWVRAHPEAVGAAVAAVAAARPGARRFLWRWARRGFVAWQLWRDSNRWLKQEHLPPSHPVR